MPPPVITLLTDFGSKDHYVAAMKGVMLTICPDARLVDISHESTPYAIAEAAWTLAQAWRCFPPGTVHLIVVDPGVGSMRRPIVAEADGHRFVAPDNGVLTMICDAVPAHEVREITAARFFREPVSRTFHGRDIFSPVAAHLANGVALSSLGDRIENYQRLEFGRPVQTGPKIWTGAILKVDWFGNLITNFGSETRSRLCAGPFEITVGRAAVSRLASNYAEMPPGELCLIAGSSGYLEISRNRGSAAEAAGVRAGDTLQLTLG